MYQHLCSLQALQSLMSNNLNTDERILPLTSLFAVNYNSLNRVWLYIELKEYFKPSLSKNKVNLKLNCKEIPVMNKQNSHLFYLAL